MSNKSEKHPPEGSIISLKITSSKVRYAWPLEPTDTISRESWVSVFYLIFTIIFMVYVLTSLLESNLGPKSLEEGIHFGNVFVTVMNLLIIFLIFKQFKAIVETLRGGIPAGLIIMDNQILYSTGSTRMQLKFSGKGKLEQEKQDKTQALPKPKSYIFPKNELEDLALERIEGYLRLSVRHRDEIIEIGATLDDSDKEWLYHSLKEQIKDL